MKFFAIGSLIIVLLVGGWFGFNKLKNRQTGETETITTKKIETGIEVTKTDITKTGTSKLPEGFPRDIPVELATISESYKAVYAKPGVTLYTVGYTSKKSKDALWNLYSDFIKGSKYTIDGGSPSAKFGQIAGTKDGDNFSVIISSRGSLNYVLLNYTDR